MRSNTPQVIANITLTLDGHTTGPGGSYDMSCIAPYGMSEEARDHLVEMTESMVAVMGRVGFEGFAGYWPHVCNDETADRRDRTFSRWLNMVDKVVISRTLNEPPDWQNTRIASGTPEETIAALRQTAEGDIRVLSSGSIIRHLLEKDEIDQLEITLAPEISAGGSALFTPDINVQSKWELLDVTSSASGAVLARYARKGAEAA